MWPLNEPAPTGLQTSQCPEVERRSILGRDAYRPVRFYYYYVQCLCPIRLACRIVRMNGDASKGSSCRLG